MRQFLLVILLGTAAFLGIAWQLELFDGGGTPTPLPPGETQVKVAKPEQLGKDLYADAGFKPIPRTPRRNADPIVLYGVMNPLDQEEVASQVNGQLIFIGEQVEDAAVLAAGSAAFLAEPYYFAKVDTGRQTFVKFYRRLYDGETVNQGQMVGMIQPAEALGSVLEEIAKIGAAVAEYEAAQHSEKEGYTRKIIADQLFANKTIGREEHATAVLTWRKLSAERISKEKAIELAIIKKDQADVRLRTCEIRPTLQYQKSTIKTIIRQRGFVAKQGDPVLVVQNLSRLLAEALVDEQYFAHLKAIKKLRPVTATIEPTILEKPLHEFLGHALDITSVAVAKDFKIVSGSEDRTVCVWSQEALAPLRKLEHDDAVKVVACTPTGAKENLCLVGCANGSIYLWDLSKEEATPLKVIDKAHGADAGISALAFSADGSYFASGGSDGSIRLWVTSSVTNEKAEYARLRYAFVPENGVARCHDDAVTALNFTPQRRLVSAGRDKTLRVWHLKENGAYPDRKPIKDRGGNVAQLGVSHDGQYLLYDLGRSLQLLSSETLTLKHALSMPTKSTPFDTLALFSPDDSLLLTAGLPEGRLQLWRAPDASTRGFEVRQFAPPESLPVSCAAFSPDAGKGGEKSFAVSASGNRLYVWPIPTPAQVRDHRIENVMMTVINENLEASKQGRIGFEVRNADGRFEAGGPVRIVID